jgi:hypothetical protein
VHVLALGDERVAQEKPYAGDDDRSSGEDASDPGCPAWVADVRSGECSVLGGVPWRLVCATSGSWLW